MEVHLPIDCDDISTESISKLRERITLQNVELRDLSLKVSKIDYFKKNFIKLKDRWKIQDEALSMKDVKIHELTIENSKLRSSLGIIVQEHFRLLRQVEILRNHISQYDGKPRLLPPVLENQVVSQVDKRWCPKDDVSYIGDTYDIYTSKCDIYTCDIPPTSSNIQGCSDNRDIYSWQETSAEEPYLMCQDVLSRQMMLLKEHAPHELNSFANKNDQCTLYLNDIFYGQQNELNSLEPSLMYESDNLKQGRMLSCPFDFINKTLSKSAPASPAEQEEVLENAVFDINEPQNEDILVVSSQNPKNPLHIIGQETPAVSTAHPLVPRLKLPALPSMISSDMRSPINDNRVDTGGHSRGPINDSESLLTSSTNLLTDRVDTGGHSRGPINDNRVDTGGHSRGTNSHRRGPQKPEENEFSLTATSSIGSSKAMQMTPHSLQVTNRSSETPKSVKGPRTSCASVPVMSESSEKLNGSNTRTAGGFLESMIGSIGGQLGAAIGGWWKSNGGTPGGTYKRGSISARRSAGRRKEETFSEPHSRVSSESTFQTPRDKIGSSNLALQAPPAALRIAESAYYQNLMKTLQKCGSGNENRQISSSGGSVAATPREDNHSDVDNDSFDGSTKKKAQSYNAHETKPESFIPPRSARTSINHRSSDGHQTTRDTRYRQQKLGDAIYDGYNHAGRVNCYPFALSNNQPSLGYHHHIYSDGTPLNNPIPAWCPRPPTIPTSPRLHVAHPPGFSPSYPTNCVNSLGDMQYLELPHFDESMLYHSDYHHVSNSDDKARPNVNSGQQQMLDFPLGVPWQAFTAPNYPTYHSKPYDQSIDGLPPSSIEPHEHRRGVKQSPKSPTRKGLESTSSLKKSPYKACKTMSPVVTPAVRSSSVLSPLQDRYRQEVATNGATNSKSGYSNKPSS
eukprot:GHVL01008782.1.p1 GENE.GHVL01008782.1~~GHVL01008782.1.p1  ORF type:complete len:908 (+),score=173.38 GHVL01008782.1:41-2764(+)